MATVDRAEPIGLAEMGNFESSISAISWGAILGGAFAAIAATFFLVSLGSALGFAAVSPWANAGASMATVGAGAAIWLVVTQWLASAFGGYLTGRLRTKWAAMQSDEVFFRDTAHGFLAWAVSTVLVVGVIASLAGGGANIAANAVSDAATAAAEEGAFAPNSYLVDSLFRSSAPTTAALPAATAPADTDERGESGRILGRAMTSDLAAADRTYLAQLVSARTGLSQADAEARVDAVVATAKQQADEARKAASALAFLTALSLVVGAFVAAAAGALGGRHRDEI